MIVEPSKAYQRTAAHIFSKPKVNNNHDDDELSRYPNTYCSIKKSLNLEMHDKDELKDNI